MAVTCTAANLMELSKCFQGLSKPQLEAIKAYLLAVEAGVESDPGDLIEAAKCFTGLSIPQLKAIQTYLLCQIANATPAPPGETDGLIWGPAPETVFSIANGGGSGNLTNFTNSIFPTSSYTEFSFGNPRFVTSDVDFSTDPVITSLTFRLLETVGGVFNFDSNVLNSFSAPLLQSVVGTISFSNSANLTSLSFPSLVTAGADIIASTNVLTSFSAPLLQTVGDELDFSNSAALINLTLPSLVSVGSRIFVSGGTIEVLSLPALTAYPPLGITADSSLLTLNLPACTDDGAGQLDTNLALMTGLVTLNIASMVTITASLTLSGSPNLASFTASAWVPTDVTTINFNGCSLDIPSVELILRRCVLAGVVACTIDLSGGTNAGTASLSAQGQADVATLGAQVTMNP